MHANRWMRGLNSTTQPSMPIVPTFEWHFSVDSNARQFAHSPTLPKSEAVAPRYSWETGTTAQSPSRCSDVLPRIPRRMFSHAYQRTDKEPASPDPTRVLTGGESDIVKWYDSTWERRNRPRLSAWGLRLTQINIAVAYLAQAPDLATAGHTDN